MTRNQRAILASIMLCYSFTTVCMDAQPNAEFSPQSLEQIHANFTRIIHTLNVLTQEGCRIMRTLPTRVAQLQSRRILDEEEIDLVQLESNVRLALYNQLSFAADNLNILCEGYEAMEKTKHGGKRLKWRKKQKSLAEALAKIDKSLTAHKTNNDFVLKIISDVQNAYNLQSSYFADVALTLENTMLFNQNLIFQDSARMHNIQASEKIDALIYKIYTRRNTKICEHALKSPGERYREPDPKLSTPSIGAPHYYAMHRMNAQWNAAPTLRQQPAQQRTLVQRANPARTDADLPPRPQTPAPQNPKPSYYTNPPHSASSLQLPSSLAGNARNAALVRKTPRTTT